MNRRNFLQVTVPTGIVLSAGLPLGAQPASSATWEIANNRLRIVCSEKTKGGLAAFTDVKSQRNFIARELPLYRLFLVQKGENTLELSSEDASTVKVDRSIAGDSETLTLSYGRHHSLDITVVCS